ncbi:MAG: toxin-antitoxin system protein [bacterium]|nr:toxin-antitoxin system protein [bacterium]
MPTMVRISERSNAVIEELANVDGLSAQHVLDEAVEVYRRQRFLDDANRAFAALRNDPSAWAEEQEERAAWDATLLDGLDD